MAIDTGLKPGAGMARRALLKNLAIGLGVVACREALGQPAAQAVYAGIETAAADTLSKASFFSATGARLAQVPLGFRAHGLAEHGRRIAVFPRRPGDRFALVDKETLDIRTVVSAPDDRHFFGHGAFTMDGNFLLTTENDLETLAGIIGVYDVTGPVTRRGEIVLPGPGPHEIARAPQTDVFYVAVGGLETHPDYGRNPLNLFDFRSQIVSFDFASARPDPLGYWAGTEGISLRHLAMDHRQRLYVGGQVKAPDRVTGQSVVWLWGGGRPKRLELADAMRGYVSSVAADGAHALVSSKQSGAVLQLDGAALIARQHLEGAGAVALGAELSVASGYTLLKIGDTSVTAMRGHEFDNHGLSL